MKKVTSDMQTHKNPSLRASVRTKVAVISLIFSFQSTVSGTSVSSGGGSPAKSPTAPVKKPPKTELQDGKSWIVVSDITFIIWLFTWHHLVALASFEIPFLKYYFMLLSSATFLLLQEYHVGNPNIIIDVTDKKQTVYVFRCENSVVKV